MTDSSDSSDDDDDSEKSSSESEESDAKKKKKKDKSGKSKGKKSKKKDSKKKKKKKDSKKKKKKKDKDKDNPFSASARERARLEAQQRLMGIKPEDAKKKKKKKKKKDSSSSSSSSASGGGNFKHVERLQAKIDGRTEQMEKELEKKKTTEEPAEKPIDEMSWPERACAAAMQAEKEAIWNGATRDEAQKAAEEAGEAVMNRAAQFGYVEERKRAKFDAGKAAPPKKLSPVEQARFAGLHAGVLAGTSQGGPKGRGHFGMANPVGSGGLEGGGYMG